MPHMENMIADYGEAGKSFRFEMEYLTHVKRLAQRLIGEQYDAVYDFFCDVLEKKSAYKIIRARRCQVLFELFCSIILLESGAKMNGTFLSSNAVERNLDELRREDASVLIVDDVLIHGRGIRRLYEYIDPSYSRGNVAVMVFCRAADAACVNKDLDSRILAGYRFAFNYEWRELSCRLVELIESSAIPYESFAGGLLSFSAPALSPDDDRFACIENSERSRVFFEKNELPPFLKEIGYDLCLRTYSSSESGPFFAVPYVFLKNIKGSACDDLFAFVAQRLDQERCSHVIAELSARGRDSAVYRMRLFSSLVNRIYGIYLSRTYNILADAYPMHMNMRLCFGREVAEDLAGLDWEDVSGLLRLSPPYEEGSIREDSDLSGILLLPDDCEDRHMYRFLSMYYYMNGRLDEKALETERSQRRNGLTMGHFYKVVDPRFRHELTAAQIKCWDRGQASATMHLHGDGDAEDCIAMFGVAGEQHFRFILEENRDDFKKRNRAYTLGFSGLKDGSGIPATPPDDPGAGKPCGAADLFASRNKELLEQFLHDNEDCLEEWFIPQFIS